MEEARDNRANWFVSARFDILFLAAFPTFLIIILSAYFFYKYNPDVQAYNYLYTLFNFPHVVAGLSAVYVCTQKWKERPIEFLWLPLIFIACLAALLLLHYYKFMGLIRIYWGCLHLFFQSYFIIWLYKLNNKGYLPTDKIIDALFLMCVYADYALRIFPFAVKEYAGSQPGQLAEATKYFMQNYWLFFVYSVLIVFAARQAYLYFARKKIYTFKILMFLAIFISYYSLIRSGRPYIAQEGSVSLHSVQWIFLIWFYYYQNSKNGANKIPAFVSGLFRPRRLALYLSFLILISIIFNYFTIFSIPSYHNLVQNPLALFHFFIEIFIWKALLNRTEAVTA